MIEINVRGFVSSSLSFQTKEGNKKEKELIYKISLLDGKKTKTSYVPVQNLEPVIQ